MITQDPHNVLVADDELPSRHYVCELFKQDVRFRVVAHCDNGRSAVAEAQKHKLDALFLDIEMPGLDGFQVVEAIQSSVPLVVFITAYGEYALRAFEYKAFDYIKKPIDPVRFSQVLDRVHQRLNEVSSLTSQVSHGASVEVTKTIPASRIKGDKKLLNAVRQDLVYRESDIRFIESAGNYVNVRINDESCLVRESLDNFFRTLNSPDLVRVHRSFVVNVQWVRKMRYGKSGSAELDLADGHVIPVSRGRRKEVADVLRSLIESSEIDDDFTI